MQMTPARAKELLPVLKNKTAQDISPAWSERLIEALEAVIQLEAENITMYAALLESADLGGDAAIRCKAELLRIARKEAGVKMVFVDGQMKAMKAPGTQAL